MLQDVGKVQFPHKILLIKQIKLIKIKLLMSVIFFDLPIDFNSFLSHALSLVSCLEQY